MRTCALLLILSLTTTGYAHRGGGGLGGDLFGRGAHGGGFGGHSFDFEAMQSRFESKFTNLMGDYDTGLAEVTNFYTTEDYMDIVSRMERLTERYDLFVLKSENYLESLGSSITTVTDRQTYYDELLAEYQARTDLSARRLERITTQIETIQTKLEDKLNFLTEQQTSLTTLLPTYTAYQTTLGAYLEEIIAAGGGTTETTAEALALSAPTTAPVMAAFYAAPAQVANVAAAAPVPEPNTLVILVAVSTVILGRQAVRDRQNQR